VGLIIVLAALLIAAIAALPSWRYSSTWGHYPSVACGAVAVALAALVIAGRI
jgi:hypothetical protein